MIGELSKGMDVLDTYCYSGGFSINAALGGANSVIAVDSSASALSAVKENLVLNSGTKKHIYLYFYFFLFCFVKFVCSCNFF
jgi:23S rRNA (cytosine1962-C5)-methyltransferase